MDKREFERDEQLLETRRLKRLEERRHRKVQQRIMLGLLLVILVLSFVLIVRGCNAHKKSEQAQNMGEDASQDGVSQASVPTEPDTTVTIAAVGNRTECLGQRFRRAEIGLPCVRVPAEVELQISDRQVSRRRAS